MSDRIARIDGLRGLSVILLVIGHFLYFRVASHLSPIPLSEVLALKADAPLVTMTNIVVRLAHYAQLFALTGVNIFFLVSGYLITLLLTQEEARAGSVSILSFYIRRLFRIVPAFAGMWLGTVILANAGLLSLPIDSARNAAAFMCNVSSCSWWFAHTWSLGVEQQFYVLWPLLFALAGRHKTKMVATLLVAFPALGHMLHPVFHQFLYILIGSCIALSPRARDAIARLAGTSLTAVCLAATLLLHVPLLYATGAGPILLPGLVAFLAFGGLFGATPITRVIALPWMQKIGLVSYSLYLWQQLSLAPLQFLSNPTGADIFLYDHLILIIAFIPIAIGSYVWIERPMVAVGRRLSSRWQREAQPT